jgi:hypothetical protein
MSEPSVATFVAEPVDERCANRSGVIEVADGDASFQGTGAVSEETGKIFLDDEEIAYLRECMINPPEPTQSIIRGAELARRLYRKKA